MAVSLFTGLFGGAFLGYMTQNGRSKFCDFVRYRHPVLFKSIGLLLLMGAILMPSLELSGIVPVDMTYFFWSGCMAFSFIFGFFIVHCQIMQKGQEI